MFQEILRGSQVIHTVGSLICVDSSSVQEQNVFDCQM
jgi:hypothetical protein